MKKTIAAFDFDGTLIKKDSFIEFALYSVGHKGLICGMLRSLPWLIAWKCRLTDSGKAKQKLFSAIFRGTYFPDFLKRCDGFKSIINKFERTEMVSQLKSHLSAGDEIYIVSASVPFWIIPWAVSHGIPKQNVIGTEIEIDSSNHITGLFSTRNCKGEEKVRRLQAVVPDLSEHELYVYGDSSGDHALAAIANHSTIMKS